MKSTVRGIIVGDVWSWQYGELAIEVFTSAGGQCQQRSCQQGVWSSGNGWLHTGEGVLNSGPQRRMLSIEAIMSSGVLSMEIFMSARGAGNRELHTYEGCCWLWDVGNGDFRPVRGCSMEVTILVS